MSQSFTPKKRLIAVPSLAPGGIKAGRSTHFGHCDCFTLVHLAGDTVTQVSVVENDPHHEGGCLDPVRLLASQGVTDIVVGGMGARPRALFAELGITVYAEQELLGVGEVVDALLCGSIPMMSALQVCSGGGCH